MFCVITSDKSVVWFETVHPSPHQRWLGAVTRTHSLAPEKCGRNFEKVLSLNILRFKFIITFCETFCFHVMASSKSSSSHHDHDHHDHHRCFHMTKLRSSGFVVESNLQGHTRFVTKASHNVCGQWGITCSSYFLLRYPCLQYLYGHIILIPDDDDDDDDDGWWWWWWWWWWNPI